VTWYEAVDFCNRLSILEGTHARVTAAATSNIVCDFTKTGYRLPTEAEWEYACRAGMSSDFFNGNMTNPDCTPVDPVMDAAGWYCGNANSDDEGGRAKASECLGNVRHAGNVWEWCWDKRTPATAPPPSTDPRGPATGSYRTYRGGAPANYYATGCRSSFRRNARPR